ncbi:esterase-like activity of phytase family protein [Polaribacter staleyi]|uniref:esterase-like activity of phytase family protein n=1 Tax=Polaribacter staleyi TaxID=2022337 RepID=UPI0031BAA4E8
MKNIIKKLLSISIVVSVFTACNDAEDMPTSLISNNGSKLPYTVLKTENNVEIRNGGFGSAATAHPTNNREFYALTDRGANLSTEGGKIFPTSNYTPRIGHFRLLEDNKIEKIGEILLKTPQGAPVSGLPNPNGYGATGEIPYDLDKNVLDFDRYGIDSEGLVALKDGTFWVSDEYGPHIVHYTANGIELERISPVNVDTGTRKIPAVFERRWANRGMEGLAITPDEKTLVGIMQSTLYNPSKAEVVDFTITRIVTFDIATAQTKQYLYRQDKAKNSNSEITALSNTEFLVIERDGKFQGNDANAQKYIYKIDISNATDVSGNNFNALEGMLINDKTIEQNTWEELIAANITPVKKTLAVDVINRLGKYPHEKMEGIWLIDDNTIGILNDDDFAVTGTDKLNQKILPGTNNIDQNTLYITNF